MPQPLSLAELESGDDEPVFEPATHPQHEYLEGLCGRHLLTEREALDLLRDEEGIEVGEFGELTKAQASLLITLLEGY